MAPKGGNAKKESGRAKKAENEAKKKDAAAAEKEQKETDKWADGSKGGKGSKEEKEEKRKAELARKAENARLLAEEEASAPVKVKTPPKAGGKKAKDPIPAGPGAIAAGGPSGDEGDKASQIESYSATGLDNALELLDVVTAKMDKASIGQQAAGIEKHPERRFKAAFEAYKERELPNIKEDHPGLRLQQYQDLMHKNFLKSSENPFKQDVVSYDATKEEKVEALKARKAQIEDRLREKA